MAGLTVLFRFLYAGFMRDRRGRLTEEWHYQKKESTGVPTGASPQSGRSCGDYALCAVELLDREGMTLVMDLHSWKFAQAGMELIQLTAPLFHSWLDSDRESRIRWPPRERFPCPAADPGAADVGPCARLPMALSRDYRCMGASAGFTRAACSEAGPYLQKGPAAHRKIQPVRVLSQDATFLTLTPALTRQRLHLDV
ncbi:hypothetical protein AAFF_G00034410 [Aldrovandia affinis]|uniref:Uncharacterized protein n=1 Tax=Aldrovandia affinis TaxID=143900 RepID=A0AAD7S3F1_9TELE|nr:hypothetical protein AAFF_G00034410 [Aldrovandia affinis]